MRIQRYIACYQHKETPRQRSFSNLVDAFVFLQERDGRIAGAADCIRRRSGPVVVSTAAFHAMGDLDVEPRNARLEQLDAAAPQSPC